MLVVIVVIVIVFAYAAWEVFSKVKFKKPSGR